MAHTLYPDWREKVIFSAEGPQPQAVLETEQLKVVLVALEPGQAIPAHPAPPAVYYFITGTGWMSVDGSRFAVTPGATVVTSEGALRGVEAETHLVFLGARAT